MKKLIKVVDFILDKALPNMVLSLQIFCAIVLISCENASPYAFLLAFFFIFVAVCNIKAGD